MEKKKDNYYASERQDILKIIPKDAKRILEVGCGAGSFAKTVKERDSAIEIVGVEIFEEAARKAKKHANQVFCENIESFQLPFEEGYFDCIVYGDVLEHLIDPWSTLKNNAALLPPGGTVIASIPNVAHYRIIKMLKRGEWTYEQSGLMDKTHLRFFTFSSIEKMFKDAGFSILKVESKIIGSHFKKFLNKITFQSLIDSLTEQYLIVAAKD